MLERSVCLVAPRVFLIASGDETQRFAGGAEVQQLFIARGLRSHGYHVTVLTGDYGQPEELELDGIRYLKIHREGRSLPVLRFFHPRLTGLWRAMAKANANIYYQRCSGINTFATAAFAKNMGRKFVFAAASDFDLDKPRTPELFKGRGGWRERQLYFLGLKSADVVVAQHAAQQAACLKWHHRSAQHMPSCYALPEGHQPGSVSGPILWVGMLRPPKRPEMFIELARRFPHLKFRMIGGMSAAENDPNAANYYRHLEASAAQLSNLEFLGFLPHRAVEKHFDGASLFINTSVYEGFPNTFLQAWARGVPTISTVNCGAVDSAGPIAIETSNVDQIAEAIDALTSQEATWINASQHSTMYFENHHSLEGVAQKYVELFDSLCHERRGG